MENEWMKALEEKDAEIAKLKNQIGGVMLHLPKDSVIIDVNKLREIEWRGYVHYRSACPVCHRLDNRMGIPGSGHNDNCWLGNILKEF